MGERECPSLFRAAAPEMSNVGEDVAGVDQTATLILELSRGLVSEKDEVAFLEVGCHTEELLDALRARTKWKVFGLEASPSAAGKAVVSRRHQVFGATLEEAPSLSEITEGFDLIYLGRGLERFVEPRLSLRSLALLLNPSGFLILRTPNLDSEQLKLLGPDWTHWNPQEHRYIYSTKSLRGILALSGFYMTKLWTLSYRESKAHKLSLRYDRGAVEIATGENSDSQNRAQAGGMTRSHQLLINRLGKGDMIHAICRRVF